ncbi:chemotaxis protein CheW [Entomomonas sp. E2T0]|uniref:chemotaxis protein CheW n=1 Tax=Entomomonas sp. E2T0 TaxID=2930213 RepID=UPI0022283EF7|nr:chemotaxis protein CheW [Entomomonas sp. E2T0]UYZ84628.1 chemotaxis protein CheW [Entomomonas sp. E2T0]
MTEQKSAKKTSLEASLISLLDRTLILPSTAVVEVVSISMPQVVAKMPRWFLGFLPWQGLRIPFISFEAICGSTFKINASSNILILKTTTESLQSKFFAILIQNTPINCTVTAEAIMDVVGELSRYELETIRINDHIAKIPNIPALEKLLIDTGVLN